MEHLFLNLSIIIIIIIPNDCMLIVVKLYRTISVNPYMVNEYSRTFYSSDDGFRSTFAGIYTTGERIPYKRLIDNLLRWGEHVDARFTENIGGIGRH